MGVGVVNTEESSAPVADWAALAAAPPGADSFGQVSTADPALLSPAQTLDLIVTTDRLIAHLHAVQMSAVAGFARPGGAGNVGDLIDALTEKAGFAQCPDGTVDPDIVQCLLEERAQGMAAAEIGAALHQSPLGAGRRVSAALELVDELPATLRALRSGRIDLPRARTIAERTRGLQPEGRRRVEAAVLPLAENRTPGQLNPMIDRRVLAVDADAVHKRCARARRDRFVDHTPGLDGMGTIRAHLPAEGAVSVYDLLERVARAAASDDGRSIAARRADALVDICVRLLVDGHVDLGSTRPPTETGDHTDTSVDVDTSVASTDVSVAGGPAPRSQSRVAAIRTQHGRGAHFNLTMSLAAYTAFTDDPAELTGHGIITAELARALQKSIRSLAVVVTNTHGNAVAVGSTIYVPNQTTTDQTVTAAGTCRFPACRIPAARCDLDHRVPFDHDRAGRGGPTDPSNLDPTCRNHHLLKTHTDWCAERSPTDGLTMVWTSPTGHRYTDHPREFALPETEPRAPRPPAPEPGTEHDTCGHTCARHPVDGPDPSFETPCVPGPPPTRADITRQLIQLRDRREEAEADLARQAAAFHLAADPTFTYRLGFTHDRHAGDDLDDDFAYLNYPEYQPPTDAFMRRFLPVQHAEQQATRAAATNPDPTIPPF